MHVPPEVTSALPEATRTTRFDASTTQSEIEFNFFPARRAVFTF